MVSHYSSLKPAVDNAKRAWTFSEEKREMKVIKDCSYVKISFYKFTLHESLCRFVWPLFVPTAWETMSRGHTMN